MNHHLLDPIFQIDSDDDDIQIVFQIVYVTFGGAKCTYKKAHPWAIPSWIRDKQLEGSLLKCCGEKKLTGMLLLRGISLCLVILRDSDFPSLICVV